MANKKKEKEYYSKHEVGNFLRNAQLAALRYDEFPVTETRVKRLRPYVEGILAPLCEHVDEKLLSPHELVSSLMAAAMYIHATYVLEWRNIPIKGAKEASRDIID
jgi:hypothetical protein